MKSRRRSGTSLVEVLVVIVVFLVGILAIVQIFPGGFKVLRATQNNTVATALGRSMIEMIKDHADQLPEQIAPVQYLYSGGNILISKQPERFPGDLGPAYSNLGQDGTMYDAGGNSIGNWQFLTGSAIGRRVIGEGKIIPTPRLIGSNYGSLLTLQFAPLIYNPNYQNFFVVYGNDLAKRDGDPTQSNFRPRSNTYFVDQEDTSQATLYLPQDPNKAISYRIEFTGYLGGGQRQDITDYVTPTPVPSGFGWQSVPFSSILSGLQSVEFDSIRVERMFDDVNVTNSGVFTADPYEYKLLSKQLGLVLFNPAGYNYIIPGSRGNRTQLIGRVSYDVYDWRIIHDEFRMPDMYPGQYRLAVGSLKVSNEMGPDELPNSGIGVQSPDSTGAFNNSDLVLEDTDTGGLYVFAEGTKDPTKTSYLVNKSLGTITFLDRDGDPSNGTQLMLLLPGDVTPQVVNVNGRSLRALYMGKNEWAVQVLKPAARYVETWGRPGIGEFYLGQSLQGDGASNPARMYFAPADAGRVVSIGELYYFNKQGIEVGPVQLTARLQSNGMDAGSSGFTNGLPYIDMNQYYPNDFGAFDYNYTTAAKNVKGASVAVRVLWNPDYFALTTDPVKNMDRLNQWMQGWRRSTVETYLQRGN